MIRVLQLTTYDEDEWDGDNMTAMRRAANTIDGAIASAVDWLQDPSSMPGGVGERALRRIIESALKVAERALPSDAEHLRKLCGDAASMADALAQLRREGDGAKPQAEALAKGAEARTAELVATVQQAISRVEKSGIQQPAPTVAGRLEQARRWLEQPGVDDRGLGRQAIQLVVEEGYKIAAVLPDGHRERVSDLCHQIESDVFDLTQLCGGGGGGSGGTGGGVDSVRAQRLAQSTAEKLSRLKEAIRTALVDRVVEDFMDSSSPLKHFTQAVVSPKEDQEERDEHFESCAKKLTAAADRSDRVHHMRTWVCVGTVICEIAQDLF